MAGRNKLDPWRPLSYLFDSGKPKPNPTVAPKAKVAIKPVVKPAGNTTAKTAVKPALPAPARSPSPRPSKEKGARVLLLWQASGPQAGTHGHTCD